MKLLKDWPVVVAMVLAGTALYAQPTTDHEVPAGKAPVETGTATNLSVTEMSVRSDKYAERTKDDLRHVLYLQQLARKQQDVIKLNCVNDRLVALRATANLFDKTRVELAPLVAGDNPERHDVFAKLDAQRGTIQDLREQADACVGQELTLEDMSSNTVEHPPFPDDPTSTDPFEGLVEPPAYASPFN